MSGNLSGAWKYFRNSKGNFSVYPERCDKHPHFPKIVVAEVLTEHVRNPEANARLMAASPEMKTALFCAVEALRVTEIFMRGQGFETKEMNEIIDVIDELLDRTEGISQEA